MVLLPQREDCSITSEYWVDLSSCGKASERTISSHADIETKSDEVYVSLMYILTLAGINRTLVY